MMILASSQGSYHNGRMIISSYINVVKCHLILSETLSHLTLAQAQNSLHYILGTIECFR